MTNDILQSDIDLARKLLGDRRPTDEIVAALAYRGVTASRAAQLVADLQAGRTVEPDRPISINLPPKATEETTPAGPKPSRMSAPADLRSEGRESRSRQRKANGFPWFTIIALTAAAVCVAIFVVLSRKAHSNVSVDQSTPQSDQSSADSDRNKRPPGLDAKAISVEVEPEGLRLCGNSVGRENFLPAIFKTLGTPTRTNHAEKADQVVYAYDSCGLLVYAPKNAGNYSIVLHFDASDGDAGTKKPFAGTFKFNKEAVRPNTDAASLGSIKELGLQGPKSASGIFQAHCGTLDLVFGYLKTPERLSLIEIDFK
jgi:hypothetical protein